MASEKALSLTGSEVGAPPTHLHAVSVALGRLRDGVRVGCWLVGAALLLQLAIFLVVNLTELRWMNVAMPPAPLVVEVDASVPVPPPPSALDEPRATVPIHDPVNPNRVPSALDKVCSIAARLAAGVGRLGVLVLVPWIGLGVVLSAGSATRGVDRVVSSFGWIATTALLLLPMGATLGLPWNGGGFWSYETLVREIDLVTGEAGAGPLFGPGWSFFVARYLVLPALCGIGITIAALQFGAGVRAGVLRREHLQLDPGLEEEAGNINPTSLHGGRTAAALARAVKDGDGDKGEDGGGDDEPRGLPGPAHVEPDPPMPKRLI